MNKDPIFQTPVVQMMKEARETFWMNPNRSQLNSAICASELSIQEIEDAQERLLRFAPLIMKCFPETKAQNGLIESQLQEIPRMQQLLGEKYGIQLPGRLLLKKDSHLSIAGSIKARGGIYEVLKHTEELAKQHQILGEGEGYDQLAEQACKQFFSQYKIQVGSTGNLGLSIGIMSAAIGYQVIVHMSSDARQWKKDLLRKHGVTVMEYESDYGEAVKQGRKLSDNDPMSYFVDDENSKDLFLGYAVAAKRLKNQLEELKIAVDARHPLFVYIPCGVGGAPGGIVFGLAELFRENVHCFFVEPVQAPCMLLGMATGRNNEICVQDIGLSGLTHADGLAVGRASGFVGRVIKPLLSGIFTIDDDKLYEYMRDLLKTEEVFIEPSAAAAFQGVRMFNQEEGMQQYIRQHHLKDHMDAGTHIIWATGGSLVPTEIREEYQKTYLRKE